MFLQSKSHSVCHLCITSIPMFELLRRMPFRFFRSPIALTIFRSSYKFVVKVVRPLPDILQAALRCGLLVLLGGWCFAAMFAHIAHNKPLAFGFSSIEWGREWYTRCERRIGSVQSKSCAYINTQGWETVPENEGKELTTQPDPSVLTITPSIMCYNIEYELVRLCEILDYLSICYLEDCITDTIWIR